VRRVTLLTAPVLALALTACGGSGPRPGTALAIDDLRVTTRHVDDVASSYCTALGKVGSKTSTQTVRNQVVGALAARLVAERFAEVRGITPDASYTTQETNLRKQLSQFDTATQDAIIEVEGAQAYVTSVVDQVGEQSFTQWLDQQHLAVNPVYGMKLDGSSFTHLDPSLSHAVSEQATSAVKAAADPSAAPAPSIRNCA
jgi:hypothetical protein